MSEQAIEKTTSKAPTNEDGMALVRKALDHYALLFAADTTKMGYHNVMAHLLSAINTAEQATRG